MSVDKSSPEYLFGRIIERLDATEKKFDSLNDEMKGLHEVLGRLPCSDSQRRLSLLEEWRKRLNGKARMSLNFKQGLVIAITAAAIGAVVGRF